MSASYTIVDAQPRHGAAMSALLPELADFVLPPRRQPEDLWLGDHHMIEAWQAGERPQCFARAAVDEVGELLGFAFVTMREELLSHAPSAHLEVLVVGPQARGLGVGASLTEDAQAQAKRRGAASMTLHVFGNNERARGLYAKLGYDEELLRCIKYL